MAGSENENKHNLTDWRNLPFPLSFSHTFYKLIMINMERVNTELIIKGLNQTFKSNMLR